MKTSLQFLMFFFVLLTAQEVSAFNKFLCQCRATGPGHEETNRSGGVDKICSYSCNCLAWEETIKANGSKQSSRAVPNIKLDISRLPTSAYSFESWDAGSHICHGQYSYKPSLSDPNWKIQVKFDKFSINEMGDVIYPEEARREIAVGVKVVGFRYTKQAKEISKDIRFQINGR